MRSRPALILQHSKAGRPARLGEWLCERRLPFVVHRAWEGPPPRPTNFAFVVSLGSRHSAAANHPEWIPHEIAALRVAVDEGVPVLGLCFGGQALSVALGGGIDVLPSPEIGWLPVKSVDDRVPEGPWLQYHSELMRVPPGASELARSPAGPAAFACGPHLGVQFHPEADAPLVEVWARTDPKLPVAGITPDALAAQSVAHAPAARKQAFRLFDRWVAGGLSSEPVTESEPASETSADTTVGPPPSPRKG